jgi:hypothetical protein
MSGESTSILEAADSVPLLKKSLRAEAAVRLSVNPSVN